MQPTSLPTDPLPEAVERVPSFVRLPLSTLQVAPRVRWHWVYF